MIFFSYATIIYCTLNLSNIMSFLTKDIDMSVQKKHLIFYQINHCIIQSGNFSKSLKDLIKNAIYKKITDFDKLKSIGYTLEDFQLHNCVTNILINKIFFFVYNIKQRFCENIFKKYKNSSQYTNLIINTIFSNDKEINFENFEYSRVFCEFDSQFIDFALNSFKSDAFKDLLEKDPAKTEEYIELVFKFLELQNLILKILHVLKLDKIILNFSKFSQKDFENLNQIKNFLIALSKNFVNILTNVEEIIKTNTKIFKKYEFNNTMENLVFNLKAILKSKILNLFFELSTKTIQMFIEHSKINFLKNFDEKKKMFICFEILLIRSQYIKNYINFIKSIYKDVCEKKIIMQNNFTLTSLIIYNDFLDINTLSNYGNTIEKKFLQLKLKRKEFLYKTNISNKEENYKIFLLELKELDFHLNSFMLECNIVYFTIKLLKKVQNQTNKNFQYKINLKIIDLKLLKSSICHLYGSIIRQIGHENYYKLFDYFDNTNDSVEIKNLTKIADICNFNLIYLIENKSAIKEYEFYALKIQLTCLQNYLSNLYFTEYTFENKITCNQEALINLEIEFKDVYDFVVKKGNIDLPVLNITYEDFE